MAGYAAGSSLNRWGACDLESRADVGKSAQRKVMKKRVSSISSLVLLLATFGALAAGVSVGAAPQGDAKTVATRIIKYNFPKCNRVTAALQLADGSIRATCDGTDYRVFTTYSAERGKMLEVALNCTAAKQHGIECF
jgi:hypothetical protein